jgi:hypothetical protein
VNLLRGTSATSGFTREIDKRAERVAAILAKRPALVFG